MSVYYTALTIPSRASSISHDHKSKNITYFRLQNPTKDALSSFNTYQQDIFKFYSIKPLG